MFTPEVKKRLLNHPKDGITQMVNYFEYVEIKAARYNRLISKFKPKHQVQDFIDLQKLLSLHSKFDSRGSYNFAFYLWHRESVADIERKMAVIRIRDHVRLLFVNKGLANCLVREIGLPLEILILVSQFLPNRVIVKFLVQIYNRNASGSENSLTCK
jgi:hypothetical protein